MAETRKKRTKEATKKKAIERKKKKKHPYKRKNCPENKVASRKPSSGEKLTNDAECGPMGEKAK